MDPLLFSVRGLSDEALLEALRRLAKCGSQLEADLLAHLGEVDVRELYLGEGHPSLFAYCTSVLHFSEGAAYLRIAAARAARSFPRILAMVRSGELHLSGVRMLAAHLTNENESKVFDRALDALLREVRRTKFAEGAARQPPAAEAASRRIPASIKRAVAKRDDGRCTFVAPDGRRCGSRDFLEFHHLVPFARAKRHRVEEIALRCRAHNRYEAILEFGAEWMARWRSS